MSEWMAPIENFYALTAVILNPNMDRAKALTIFNIKIFTDSETPIQKIQRKRPPKEELFKMNETMSQDEIALYYKVSQPTISKWFRQYKNNEAESKQRKIEIDNAEYDRLKSKGLKDCEIAKIFNVSVSKVSVYKKERGLRN